MRCGLCPLWDTRPIEVKNMDPTVSLMKARLHREIGLPREALPPVWTSRDPRTSLAETDQGAKLDLIR